MLSYCRDRPKEVTMKIELSRPSKGVGYRVCGDDIEASGPGFLIWSKLMDVQYIQYRADREYYEDFHD
jgi:hypothetical protein